MVDIYFMQTAQKSQLPKAEMGSTRLDIPSDPVVSPSISDPWTWRQSTHFMKKSALTLQSRGKTTEASFTMRNTNSKDDAVFFLSHNPSDPRG